MFTFIFLEAFAFVLGAVAVIWIIRLLVKVKKSTAEPRKKSPYLPLALFVFALILGVFSNKTYPPNFAMPMFMHAHTPDRLAPSIPLLKIVEFFRFSKRFERVVDIRANPSDVPLSPQKPDEDGIVRIELEAKEVVAEISPGIFFNYWTYNNQVPGPMLRVREGDTVEISLSNHVSSLHHHNIDLHSVTGPGGGAKVTNVAPGEKKTFRWKALAPGLFVYHCAMPNVSTHNSHGQFGLILVEPKEGLPPVDREFYIVQGELYTQGDLGKKGLVPFDSQALLDGIPNYVVFNGRVEGAGDLKVKTGEKVRMYVGNGGVNLISSFHIIGEIFDSVYPNASMSGAREYDTQATEVLPGGAAIVEFSTEVPGDYLLVDHALARMNKGAWGVLKVEGSENKEIFTEVELPDPQDEF